ncbi:DUF1758 domain-containing protein [Nephila pilipes]|uniref:DUF1758 domain-containing protein n=1 Tax=Nephila pilipes TaxID=299642 RepID=A0A8X6PG62_NEPPI|nr:DUF1758 domain-containing protein [Nephila pilipes]
MLVQGILDSASEINIKTSDCADSLDLKKEKKIFFPIGKISGSTQNAKTKVRTALSNFNRDVHWNIDMVSLPKITEFTFGTRFDISNLKILNNIQFANKTIYNS